MSGDPLILVHLSDIHFRQPAHGGAYDLDAPLRDALERNAVAVSRELGAPHAILVTGDIAFSGKKEEYQDASTWLERLCANVGCMPIQVWCVPGNHDVDRQVILERRSLRDARTNLRKCDPREIDREIGDYLAEPTVFYVPIAAYNTEFAARFQCELTKDAPVWQKDFTLNDNSVLRLHGFNSVLISDSWDNDGEHKLVLGRHQYSGLTAQDGVEHVVLCHHPPEWLRERDEVEVALAATARIQLFGHKHSQRLVQINNTLRISAGAVGPCPREPSWQPRYNWVTVRITTLSGNRVMEICVFPKVWNPVTRAFDADYNSAGGREYRMYQLPLPTFASHAPAPVPAHVDHGLAEPKSEQAEPALEEAGVLDDPIMDHARVLAHRYFSLDYVKKMQIADRLGLHDDSDASLGGVELFLKHLERAKARGQLKELWDAVEVLHGDGTHPDNPYAGETRKG